MTEDSQVSAATAATAAARDQITLEPHWKPAHRTRDGSVPVAGEQDRFSVAVPPAGRIIQCKNLSDQRPPVQLHKMPEMDFLETKIRKGYPTSKYRHFWK